MNELHQMLKGAETREQLKEALFAWYERVYGTALKQFQEDEPPEIEDLEP